MSSSQARRWVFTLNNPSEDEEQSLADRLSEPSNFQYAVFGREQGESGTPHLQGFLVSTSPRRLNWLRLNVSPRAHFEVARGTSQQAAAYCKKDGVFDEFGTFPDQSGRRTDIERFKDWIEAQPRKPSERDIAREFPGLFLRYPRLMDLVGHLRPQPVLAGGLLREWQSNLDERLRTEPDDRSVDFFVDLEGAKGKSWFVRYQMTKFPEETQFLSVGKRDDLAYAIDETKRVFLFDLPRGSMEHFQYNVLEKLKDKLVFSAKYASKVKVLEHNCHVVVFCNEHPDMQAMSIDRYNVVEL